MQPPIAETASFKYFDFRSECATDRSRDVDKRLIWTPNALTPTVVIGIDRGFAVDTARSGNADQRHCEPRTCGAGRPLFEREDFANSSGCRSRRAAGALSITHSVFRSPAGCPSGDGVRSRRQSKNAVRYQE
jgi:hypothetical protein